VSRKALMMLLVVMTLVGGGALMCTRMKNHRQLGAPGVKVVATPSLDQDGNIVRTNSVKLPELVLNYNSEAVGLTPVELQTLPEDTIFGRRVYHNPNATNDQIILSAVLMGVDSRSIHKPEICLPAQGWRIQETPEILRFGASNEWKVPIMKMVAHKTFQDTKGIDQSVTLVMVYWFVTEGHITASHMERMWLMGREILSSGTLQRWAFMSCYTLCQEGGETAGYSRLEHFLAAALPEVQIVERP